MSTMGFLGTPDLVTGLKLHCWYICQRSNNILVSFWLFMIFVSHIGFAGMRISRYHEIFRYAWPSGVIRMFCNYRIVSKILDARQNIS